MCGCLSLAIGVMTFRQKLATLHSNSHSLFERSLGEIGVPPTSAIFEERRRKGGLESTCWRGLGYSKIVPNVTKFVFLALTGTVKANVKANGCNLLLNHCFYDLHCT